MRNLGTRSVFKPCAAGGSIAQRSFNSILASSVLLVLPAFGATKVVAIGDAAPTGGTFASVGGTSPMLLGTNDRGDVLFWSGLADGRAGLFLFTNGQFTKIAAEGDATPIGGTFPAIFPTTAGYHLNANGDVAFTAQVDGGSSALGVFLYSSGSLSKVVASGDQAPLPALIDPTTDPDIFVPVFGFSIDLNDNGEVVFFAMQGKPAGTSYVSRGGIYLAIEGGEPTRILASGLSTDVGNLILTPGTVLGPFVNNSDQFALWASTDQTNEAIFLCAGESCQKVVAVNDPIPGGTWPAHSGPCCITGLSDSGQVGLQGLNLRGEVLFWSGGAFSRDLAPGYSVLEPIPGTLDSLFATQAADLHPINRFGEIAVSGQTDVPDPTAYGIFTLSDANLRKPVSAGDSAPSQGTFTSFGRATLNNNACIAFEANTTGPSGFYYSLWQSDSQAVTKEKARKFFQDVDDHTINVDAGRGTDLLRQIYGADLTVDQLKARVAMDLFDGFGAFADKPIRIRIFDAHGRSVPASDRDEVTTRRNALRDSGVFQRLSFLQLELMRRNFKTCNNQIDFGKLRRASDMFANGELRTGDVGQREMNQLYQWLLWIEFAESAIAVGQDADSWQNIFPALVSGLEIYRQVYPAVPLGPDASDSDKMYGEFLRSEAARFDPTRQLTEPQKRDIRSAIDALSPSDLRDRLRNRIADMTTVLHDAIPRRVEFASATADPSGSGFNIGVRLRITDGGVPVTDAIVPLYTRELGIALPGASIASSTQATGVGGGEYAASFFVAAPPIGISMFAFDDASLAEEGLSLLLIGSPAGATSNQTEFNLAP